MKYAVSIPPFVPDARQVSSLAQEAERAGWDGVFLWDHLQWSADSRPPVLDPWVLLGAIAQTTERVRIGTLVTPLSRRRPWVVAKHLTTLDHLSDGRVTFAVGLGEPPDLDFGDLGDEADPKHRATLLDEGLEVIDGLLRGGPFTHGGDHFPVQADFRPGPVQKPRPPIWVAGIAPNRRPLERARRWDGVVPIGKRQRLTPDELASYVGSAPRAGWDVVATPAADVPADEYEDAGATWLVESAWPVKDGWFEDLEQRVRRGPAR